ncbi:hypothetical protein F5144DRAFT_633316 [Chaetomium tenue]|uniref:Uncharacterized protein n=1 Tax=Chaetomium tenue TaxID=1854479 RepID=A0ACB7NUH4_9PEZI|nr:hypothetical protein F5144DRAFT_633316 [Chaetomium globosum]
MTLTVLTDDQIRSLLENLTVDDLDGFQNALISALHEHSAGAQSESAIHQPERVSIHSPATGCTTLFMPSANSTGNAVKVITLTAASTTTTPSPTPSPSKPTIRPTGAITLLSPTGTPLGLLHAAALTAFRTALGSLSIVRRRAGPLTRLVVFGCGEQAYWHVRLALLARGSEVREVVFVGRGGSKASEGVVGRFVGGGVEGVKKREGWEGCRFEVLVRDGGVEAEGRLREVLRGADVVFCCTPSTEAVFDAGVFEGVEKGRLVVAIGSYTPQMREIPAGLVRQALTVGEREAGVVVVDTIEGALTEAGELIEVGIKPEQMVELGALAGDKKSHDLEHWLQTGNVIYKSVGFFIINHHHTTTPTPTMPPLKAALTLHLLTETPASLSFLLTPQAQLPGASPEARLILRNFGGLLLATNLACLALLGGGRITDDAGDRATALFCAGLGTYHVWPIYRAWVRMGGKGEGRKVLGGPVVHFGVHVVCLVALVGGGVVGLLEGW